MRIGVNARLLLTHRMEGIARYTWEALQIMIAEHPEDQFVLFFDRAFDKQFTQASNVQGVSVFPQARHPILWKIWFDFTLPMMVKRYKVDVFWSPDGFASLTMKIPQLMTTHDLTYYHYPESMRSDQLGYYQKNVPRFHQVAKHISTVSQSTKDDIVVSLGIDERKISVAMNALSDTENYKSESQIEGDYLLYLGSIHPRKNIGRLLLAYEDFRSRNSGLSPKMVIAGRKAFGNNDLDNIVAKMQFGQDVIFTGMVSEKQKYNLLKDAQIFIYISLFEGFGIPILEAMSVGTPVITSNVGALHEVSGGATFGLDPTNTEAISDGIERLYSSETLQQKLISTGSKRVSDFSWDVTAEKIYTQIQKLYTDK